MDDLEEPTGFGGDFGVAAKFTITKGLEFAPEIAFRLFYLDHRDDYLSRQFNMTFLDFAFYVRGAITNAFYLEVGPQISINTSGDYPSEQDGKDYSQFENIEQTPVEFGLNIGGGYYILDNLSIGFRWYMGFNEVFPDVKLYNNTTEDDITQDDIDPKTRKPKSGIKYSTTNLKGAHTMMFKLGVTYWFL
jgi:hypothetical protein